MEPVESNLLQRFELPFAKRIDFIEVVFEDGVKLLRVRIKEKSRFTIFDLDPNTAQAMGDQLRLWAEGPPDQRPDGAE